MEIWRNASRAWRAHKGHVSRGSFRRYSAAWQRFSHSLLKQKRLANFKLNLWVSKSQNSRQDPGKEKGIRPRTPLYVVLPCSKRVRFLRKVGKSTYKVARQNKRVDNCRRELSVIVSGTASQGWDHENRGITWAPKKYRPAHFFPHRSKPFPANC